MPTISIWARIGIYAACLAAVVLGMLRIYDAGYTARGDEDNAKILQANATFEAAAKLKQEASDKEASAKNAAHDASYDAIMGELRAIKGGKAPNRPTTTLATTCLLDDAWVKYANED
jgi:hypothetical protein